MTDFPGVPTPLAQALSGRGYTDLTPVQVAMLDPALAGEDLLVSAQTGSGKTVAFGIALGPSMLAGEDKLARPGAPLSLVVAPTRELALQVKRELEWLYAGAGASIASCVGGMDMRDERRALTRGAHIVVGTPGRLVDHINKGSLNISALEAVVLDEADEMLDLGFREDLETILGAAPEERRTLLFSATVSRPIAALAKNFQRNAQRVNTAGEEKQHGDIEYRALSVASYDRENAIINVLRYYEAPNAIIFCGTRANVNHLTARLNNRGFSVVALSGELSQKERTHALQAMRDGRAQVCVATDVAARGIDLPGLDLVVHADLPKNNEGLLHRSGRTGRAGKKGVSTLIVPFNARKRVERLLSSAKVKAVWAKPPSADEVIAKDNERLLNDPSLQEIPSEADQLTAQALIAEHGADQVAAAFVRLHRGRKSAPEDISDAPPREKPWEKKERGERRDSGPRESGPREDFTKSQWVSLSVGRTRKAEARWLLPMLCKSGGISKADIGAIRVQDDETHVQLNAVAADGFLKRMADQGELEDNIFVTAIDAPTAQRGGRDHGGRESGGRDQGDRPNKPHRGKKPFGDKKSFGDKKPFAGKGKPPHKGEGKPPHKGEGKPSYKSAGRKAEGGAAPHKPKRAKYTPGTDAMPKLNRKKRAPKPAS